MKILLEFYSVEIYSEKEFLIKFGEQLKKLRKSKNFTQSELAIDLGVEISQISRIERGLINTSTYNIYRISKTLNIEIEDLYNFN